MPAIWLRPGPQSFKDDQITVLDKILQLLEDVLNGRLDAVNLADGAVGTAQLDDGAVTQAKVADGVGRVASADYTGDGTADRTIALDFTPRWVHILRTDNSTEFWSMRGTSTRAWWRTSTGDSANGLADWQGIVSMGFKLGSASNGGLSNASGVAYAYVAIG